MIRQRRRPRVRRGRRQFYIDPKYLWVAGGVLASIVLVIVLISLFSARTFVAEEGTISFSQDSSGVVIRKEMLYKADNYGKTEFIAQEGQVVTKGTPIADVYSWDYSDQDYEDLKQLQEKIMDYQQNNVYSNIRSEDLDNLNAMIDEKTAQVRSIVKGEAEGDLLALNKELENLMDERAAVLRDSTRQDDQLKAFYDEETALKNKIDNWKQTILAEDDGVISFYFDGTEALLTPENMTKLTVKNINDILEGKSSYTTTDAEATASRALYRLVDQDEWYVVMICEDEVPEFENNTAFQVEFSYGEDYKYSAAIYGHNSESGKEIYYLAFSEPVDKLLLARQVEFQISADYVGIKVPLSAVKTRDGVTGVYYKGEDGKKEFEPAAILIQQDKECIIEPIDLRSSLDVGSEIYY